MFVNLNPKNFQIQFCKKKNNKQTKNTFFSTGNEFSCLKDDFDWKKVFFKN